MDSYDFGHWVNWCLHSLSTSALIGAFLGILPPIAAVVAFCWYCLQIYESRTFQRYVKARRARKIARLKAQVHVLEAAIKHHETRHTSD